MNGETRYTSKPRVLVTGGTGYVGSHVILRLLRDGYNVRTTVRSQRRADELRERYEQMNCDELSFAIADLDSNEGWDDAAADCTFVLHVASPFPLAEPMDENDVIGPARDGTLRVMRAARDAGVKRVVLTSSFAAVGYSAKDPTVPYNEADWTDPNDDISTYVKSKTIAEREAWNFVEREGNGLELSVINPVAIFGPVNPDDSSSSLGIFKQLIDGSMPAAPKVAFGIVDVRDVADLHVRAMLSPDANGQRFIASAASPISLIEIAEFLRSELGEAVGKVPKRQMPNALVRFAALFRADLRPALRELGKRKSISNEKARSVLGWSPRPIRDTVLATAQGLMDLRLIEQYAKQS